MKNKIQQIRYFLASSLMLAIVLGCDNFVEVDLPSSQLTGEAIFQDKQTATAALVEVYAKMRDNGLLSGNVTGITLDMGLYADELDYFGPMSDATGSLYQNSLIAGDSNIQQIWNLTYNQIYGANAVLEGLEGSPIAAADKNQMRGEALFIRSLLHFHLANTFGAIPLVKTTDYETNRRISRTSVAEVYSAIISDLEEAATLVQEEYPTVGRVRPNKATVNALLSKVYLYDGQWAEAANAASSVINQSIYSMDIPLSEVFLKASSSTIWQFQPKAEGNNTDFGITFIFTTSPPPFAALSNSLMASFEAGDNRKSAWTTAVTNGSSTYYHAAKYDQNGFTGASIEYPIVFRLQEMYLIRAEARARQGETINAKEDLDAVREVAGLAPSPAVGQQELIEAILRERRIELFAEYGNRFYDLKRFGVLDVTLDVTKAGWDATDSLWPIPDAELRANTNLAPQNAGY